MRVDLAAPPPEFLERLAEAERHCSLRIVAVVACPATGQVGADDAQARTFADRVISAGDLVRDRERLRGVVAEVV